MELTGNCRHELKYPVSLAAYLALRQRLRPVMQRDPHAGADGRYTIRSIYFDNYRDKALREKLDGVQRREKFRIRYYNDDLSFITLEKKIKYNDLCMKLDAPLHEADYQRLLRAPGPWMLEHPEPFVRELYETIWDGEVTATTKADHKRVVTALKNISEGTDLETYMDVDNLLRYMAGHVFSVNGDSLSGSMAHNYYLYESGGKLNLIPWDYNLALGGMGSGNDATSVVNDAIDNAFSGTTFFDTLIEDATCRAQYYAYLQQLVSEYIDGGGFDAFYERVRSQSDALVQTDPTAFYSYDEYLTAVDTLYQVVKLRGQSIQGQLDGTIPSAETEQRGSDALVDASALDLSTMGYMNNGGGFQARSAVNPAGDTDTESEPAQPGDFTPPQGFENTGNFGGSPPMAGFSGGSHEKTSQTVSTEALALYGGSLLLLAAAMLFACLYRRRPGKR